MPARKNAAPELPKFITAEKDYNYMAVDAKCQTEATAIEKATARINRKGTSRNPIGIYQLIALVKPKDVPVEVERLAMCKEKKAE